MKRFYLLILTVCASATVFSQQLPSQVQAKRGVFTERLFLSDRWIDRISTSVPSIYDSSDNILPTTKAMADLFRLHSIQSAPISADGDYIHNWNHKILHIDSINRLQFEEFETDSTFPELAPKVHNTFRMIPGMLADSAINLISVLRNIDNGYDSITSRLSLSSMGAQLHTDNSQGSFNVNLSGNSVYLGAIVYNGDFPQVSSVTVSPTAIELAAGMGGHISMSGLPYTDYADNYKPLVFDDNTGQIARLNAWPAGNSRVYVDTTYIPAFTALNNVASISGGITAVMRIGNIVHVSGLITISPDSASGTHTSLEISLPWFSQLIKNTCTGTGFNSDYQMGAQIVGDPVNNKALLKFASLTTNPVDFSFSFQYIIYTQGE